MIRLNNVSKSFGDDVLFEEINLDLSPGSYVLTGENGAGKSTFMNIIAGQCTYQGSVDLGSINSDEISYVSQTTKLFRKLTVKQNLSLFLTDTQIEEANKFVSKIGFEKLIRENKRANKLSGGERQKLQLLIGLFRSSKILILDEFDNNLDIESINVVIDQIALQNQQYIFIISHDKSIVEKYINYELKFENNNVELQIINDECIVSEISSDDEQEDNKNRLVKKDFGLFNKYNKLNYAVIAVATFVTLAIVLNIATIVSINMAKLATVTTEPFADNVSIITAPRYTNQYANLGDETWLETTKYGFTQEQYDMLTNLDYVENAFFIQNPYNFNNLTSIKYGDEYVDFSVETQMNAIDLSTIDYEALANELEVDEVQQMTNASLGFVQLQSPSKVYEATPLTLFNYGASQLIYGSTPKDNSNEIAIDMYVASLLAKDSNIPIEQLVGEEVSLSLEQKDIDNYQTIGEGDYTFKISGIYNTTKPGGVVYSYQKNSVNTEEGTCNNIKSESAEFSCRYTLGADEQDKAGTYLETIDDIPMSDFGLGMSLYVEVSDGHEEDLITDVASIDQYIEVDNNYARTHNDSSFEFFKKLKLNIIYFVLAIIMIVLITIIMFKFVKRTLKKNIMPILKHYHFEHDSFRKIKEYQKFQLIKIIFMTEALFMIVYMIKVKFYFSLFMLIIAIICVVIFLLLCLVLKILK